MKVIKPCRPVYNWNNQKRKKDKSLLGEKP